MKKIFWASVVMMSLVACGENESDTLLTPDEQKVEMETIASDLRRSLQLLNLKM